MILGGSDAAIKLAQDGEPKLLRQTHGENFRERMAHNLGRLRKCTVGPWELNQSRHTPG